MARINPNATIATMSGKANRQSNIYYRTDKQTGRVYTGTLLNPSRPSDSVASVNARTKFGQRVGNASAWLAANKPGGAQPNGSELYQKVYKSYKSQTKMSGLFAYIVHLMDEEGNVRMGGQNNNTGSGDMG